MKTFLVTAITICGVGFLAGGVPDALKSQVALAWETAAQPDPETDPAGFADHAKKALQSDLKSMRKSRRILQREADTVSTKIAEQATLLNQARLLADEFREVYQDAKANEGFPVEIHTAAYTEKQLKSQVSMLLAEIKGYEKALEELRSVQRQAEEAIENFTVQINSTQTQLDVLQTKRELLIARNLSSESKALVVRMDEQIRGNAEMIKGNPVRTVRQLAETVPASPATPTRMTAVEEYLNSSPSLEPVKTEARKPTVPQQQPRLKIRVQQTEKPKQQKKQKTRPIFQQS